MNIWDRSKKVADDKVDDAPKETKADKPLKRRVMHSKCKTISVLGIERATAFAKDPDFDSELYCAHCKSRRPVSEFSWRA